MEALYQRPSLPFMDLVKEEIKFLRSNREISRICFSVIYEALGPHPELQDALKLLNNRFAQIWHLWIEHQERHGYQLRANNRDNLVRIIVSTISGVTVNSAVNPEVDTLEVLEDFSLLIEPAFYQADGRASFG